MKKTSLEIGFGKPEHLIIYSFNGKTFHFIDTYFTFI